MRWERRRSRWPYIASLCALLGLTLLGPLLWRRAHSRRERPSLGRSIAQVDRTPTIQGEPSRRGASPAEDRWTASTGEGLATPIQPPALPPLASGETSHALSDLLQAKFAEPSASSSTPPASVAEPIVESSDYESFELPHYLPYDGAAIPDRLQPQSARVATASLPSELDTSNVASTPAPASIDLCTVINVDSILAIRDSLASLIGQYQGGEPPKPQATRYSPQAVPRVRVESSSDRVALAVPPASSPALTARSESAVAEQTSDDASRASVNNSTRPDSSRPPDTVPPVGTQKQESRSTPPSDAKPGPKEKLIAEKREPFLWYPPEALIAQLKAVAPTEPHASWAAQSLAEIDILVGTPASNPQAALEAIAVLRDLASEATHNATSTSDRNAQAEWLRLGQAVGRRLALWERLAEADSRGVWRPSIETADRDDVLRHLSEIETIIAGAAEGPEWRQYLLVDELSALASVGALSQAARRRQSARELLDRFASPMLTEPQRRFIALPPIESLQSLVQPWASGTVNLSALSGLLDRYEATGSARYGDLIHEQIVRMRWSGRPEFEQLAQEISRDYRGANVRVALSGELLNRMLPQQGTVVAPVRERVAGSDVRGRSQTSTQLRVRLLPDPSVLRFGLEAAGDVRSQTYSDTWPAQVRNVGQMQYEARKLIIVNRHGLHAWPADADAFGNNRLVGVESQLDPLPIVGSIVQGIARQQHRERRSLAMRQVRNRVVEQAQSRMDRQADVKLQQMEDRFEAAVLRPLESLALAAEPLDMYTTEQRAVMRLRLANQLQLAAHTPRPSAPSDSLASVQLHESALNNAARGLELERRQMGAGELQRQLAEKLHRTPEPLPHGTPERSSIQFADHEAIRIRCDGDRLELILTIAELARGRDRIEDVEVHAFFRPVVDGMQVKLLRDGTLQFNGRRLLTAQRIVLHTVFGKLLPKDAEIPLLAPRIESDERLDGLMITQLVIDDGWLAVAVGPRLPHRAAWRTPENPTR